MSAGKLEQEMRSLGVTCPAGYAGALRQWCVRQGWTEPAAVAQSAVKWMAATAAVTAAAVVVLLLRVSPGLADPDSSFSPSVVFGRPLGGAGAGVAFVTTFVVWIVATIRLRKTSQLIRHGLRSDETEGVTAQ